MAEDGPRIGKAYVQIIPTTKGIKKAMEAEITGSASEAAEKEGHASGSGFAGAFARALAAGTAAISAAAIKIGKEALSSYADYEQLVGGVETLFGLGGQSVEEFAKEQGLAYDEALKQWQELTKAQRLVTNNADAAFRTAGLSANEYMETVTGFAASLISSVSGDTEKAAKLADQAIVDMSDNANKMGSSMESIQNAYQGFAKQNYTMLDNLKLGYGGTASEMYRLMETAATLDEEFAATAVFSLDEKGHLEAGYADIVQAIHIVQTEMGITGTTALEAENTISGSLGMLKASFQNLITDLGHGEDAFMEENVKNVTNSLNALLTNITPIIENIVAALPEAITGMLNAAAPMLPTVLEAGVGIFKAVLEGLIQMLPEFIPVAIDVLGTLISTIIENLPLLMDAAMQLITSLAQDIGENLPILIPAIVDILLQIVNTLTEPEQLTMLINAAIEIMLALTDGLIDAIPTLLDSAPTIITNLVDAIIENAPKLLVAALEIILKLVAGCIDNLPEIGAAAGEIVGELVNGLMELVTDLWDVGKEFIEGIWNGINDKKDWIKEKISGFCDGILDGIKGFFGIHSPSKVMADMVGANLALGIGEGFSDEMAGVRREMAKDMDGILRDMTDAGETNLNTRITRAAQIDAQVLGGFGGGIVTMDPEAMSLLRSISAGNQKTPVIQASGSIRQLVRLLFPEIKIVEQLEGESLIV